MKESHRGCRPRTALELLAGQVTDADATRVAISVQRLSKIDERSGELRDNLDECGGQPVTSLDVLGPLPRNCVALPPSMIDL